MAKVTVYKVNLYNASLDEVKVSKRMATSKGIEMMSGWAVEGSAIEIDDELLENGEQWTPINFDPNPRPAVFPNAMKQ